MSPNDFGTNLYDDLADEEKFEIEGESFNIDAEIISQNADDRLSIDSEEFAIDINQIIEDIDSTLSPEQSLAWWYSSIPIHKKDILNEVGGNENMLISLEGIIYHFIGGDAYKTIIYENLQFLQLTSRIEATLYRIRQFGCTNYSLISFKCLKATLCRKSPAIWAYRNMLLLHFKSTNISIYEFENWLVPDYNEFIIQRQPFVYLCEDGSGIKKDITIYDAVLCTNPKNKINSDKLCDDTGSCYEIGEHGYSALYALIIDCLSKDIYVAFFYNMQFSGTSINCFGLYSNVYTSSLLTITKEVVEIEESVVHELELLINTNEIIEYKYKELSEQSNNNYRKSLLITIARDLILEIESNEVELYNIFFKAFLLHIIALENLTLIERKCVIPSIDSDYENILDLISIYMQQYTDIISNNESKYSYLFANANVKQFVDLIDEVLLRRCYYFLVTNSSQIQKTDFNDNVSDELEYMWSIIINNLAIEVKIDKTYFPIKAMISMATFAEKLNSYINANKLNNTKIEINEIKDNLLTTLIDNISTETCRQLNVVNDKNIKQIIEANRQYFYSSFNKSQKDLKYDLSLTLLNQTKMKSLIDKVPAWIYKLKPDNQAKAIQKWRLKTQQETKLFARNVNKYMGSLDKLHKPMVLVGDKCLNTHPWRKEKINQNQITDIDSGKVVMKKEKKEKKLTKSSKAAAIIEKNIELKEEKTRKKDADSCDIMINNLNYIFTHKLDSPLVLHNSLVEFLIGNRNALDTAVLEDFIEINKNISDNSVKLTIIEHILRNLINIFSKHWNNKKFSSTNFDNQILTLLGFSIRIVNLTVQHYLDKIRPEQIKLLQTLLLVLGMSSSAKIIYNSWVDKIIETQSNADATLPKVEEKKKQLKNKLKEPIYQTVQKSEKKDEVAKNLSKYNVTSIKPELKSYFAVKDGYEYTFQLEFLGNNMTRSLGSTPDARVNFNPDQWQVKLLDLVDNLISCLVIAPTSSGKTFACYYVMDQVLRYDNESCVVFVSPTRALALQVESEVIARFSGKAYPTGSKNKLYGRLYDDRNENWNTCQILITVPSAFQTILMSKNLEHQEWLQKVKYAIIDEVHCIGDSINGSPLQTILRLLPCPFMALSATIGNASNFSDWLASIQLFGKNRKFELIIYRQRYADLQTMYYTSEHNALYYLNPVICVSYSLAKTGFLKLELQLTPLNCLQLYFELLKLDIFKNSNDPTINFFITYWNPERYFEGSSAIAKYQYLYWQNSLFSYIDYCIMKNLIDESKYTELMLALSSHGPIDKRNIGKWYFNATIDENASNEKVKAPTLEKVLKTELVHSDDVYIQPENFMKMFRNLENQSLLPVLLFNFNRIIVSQIFHKVINYLVDKHYEKYHGTPEKSARTKAINKERFDKHRAELARREQAEKWKTLTKQQREEQGIDEETLAELTGTIPDMPTKIEDEHDSEFYFCDKRMYLGYLKEFKEILNFCRIDYFVKTQRIPKILVEGLIRGIGIYHDALHREYRRAVELLFRARYLKVVVSDIALSLGINMPCRTTIFAGNMANISPLLYRQTAGRAGRRGFDNLGNVIFWNLPQKKMTHVICAKLQGLTGENQLTLPSVISKLNFFDSINDYAAKAFANKQSSYLKYMSIVTKMLANLFIDSLHAHNNVYDKRTINILYKYTFKILIDHLNNLGIIDNDINISCLTAFAEALDANCSNGLFFVYCLLRGYFNVNETINENNIKELCNSRYFKVLEHCILQRYYCHNIVRKFELAAISHNIEKKLFNVLDNDLMFRFSPLIAPMDKELLAIADDFDKLLFSCYSKITAILNQVLNNSCTILQLSGLNFDYNGSENIGNMFSKYIEETKTKSDNCLMQSLFESGRFDRDYTTIELIYVGTNCAVPIDYNFIPFINHTKTLIYDRDKKNYIEIALKNNYLRELVYSNSLRRIIINNYINNNDAYYLANEAIFKFYCINDAAEYVNNLTNNSDSTIAKIAKDSEKFVAVANHVTKRIKG